MKTIVHVDFNSYFATVEQQANPRLRGKPIGVTGGDRLTRTVIGAASIEAKKYGVKTGMRIPEALALCPNLILVRGDSNKYLVTTQKFLNILKDYSPKLEVFSIDEAFIELSETVLESKIIDIAIEIKNRIKNEIGEYISCSIGISYNKLMAKLAGSLYKPDGLVWIKDTQSAQFILDQIELDEVCGIGFRIKKRLNNLGIFDFKKLRLVPLNYLLVSFKSYGQVLYNMARGLDYSKVVPFFEKEEVKSVGHRYTINRDVDDLEVIKQILLKLTELIARKLRSKNLVGKTVNVWYRNAFDINFFQRTGQKFVSFGRQITIFNTQDGLEIFKAAWSVFLDIWNSNPIRMIGVSISNLRPNIPKNLIFLEDELKNERITKALDKINDRYGEFTLQRGVLLNSTKIYRKPNSYLSDRRFKI